MVIIAKKCHKAKGRSVIWPTYTPVSICLKDSTSYFSNTCSAMFTVILFTVAKKYKQGKCSSVDEWIMKMGCLYTIKYYSTVKKKEIIKFSGKMIEVEHIILSETTETQKDKHKMSLLSCSS